MLDCKCKIEYGKQLNSGEMTGQIRQMPNTEIWKDDREFIVGNLQYQGIDEAYSVNFVNSKLGTWMYSWQIRTQSELSPPKLFLNSVASTTFTITDELKAAGQLVTTNSHLPDGTILEFYLTKNWSGELIVNESGETIFTVICGIDPDNVTSIEQLYEKLNFHLKAYNCFIDGGIITSYTIIEDYATLKKEILNLISACIFGYSYVLGYFQRKLF